MAEFHEPTAHAPLTKAAVRSVRALSSKRGREESGLFVAEGTQAVREALLRPGVVDHLIVDDPTRHAELLALATDVPIFTATSTEVAQLADTVTPQGVFAVCHQFSAGLADLGDCRLVVICSQVRDPGNAGTVIRCADAFGADAVILTKGSVDLFNPKTIRSSVGSVFHLPVATGLDLAEAVTWCRDRRIQVLAADGGGDSLDVLDAAGDLARPTAWIMGNEAWGLPEADRELADRVVGVPMWGQAESLNLSTAAAVCLYATASAQRAAN